MRKIVAVLAGAMLTTSALAETPAFRDNGPSRAEGVVGLGLTIPLGGVRHKEPPRVELRIARDRVGFDGHRESSRADFRPIESRVGFSLERESKLLVNGRQIDERRRNNMSTVGWIAVGVGVTLIGAVLLVADAARDASD